MGEVHSTTFDGCKPPSNKQSTQNVYIRLAFAFFYLRPDFFESDRAMNEKLFIALRCCTRHGLRDERQQIRISLKVRRASI